MRTTLALTALIAAFLLAPSANAADYWVVKGAGFGHGIGMSQYGAYGFAQRGTGYRDILAHYYRGTEIGSAQGQLIRVLLQSGRPTITFSGANRVGVRGVQPGKTYFARLGGGGIQVRDARGKTVGAFTAPLLVRNTRGGLVRLGGWAQNGVTGGQYRGGLELRPGTAGGVTAVNAVGLDDYVRGVVPGEVPASWPVEALRAQAVAARTYALATDAGGPVFDQYADTRSQVYRGVTAEQPSTDGAVRDTAGEVVRYQGRIAVTYFFSTSGGRTENVENVFYGAQPAPYLVSVEDPYDKASPRHRWRLQFSQGTMQAKLSGLVKGTFRGIKVIRRGVSPRVVQAQVIGSGGRSTVSGSTLRARLGLFDNWFRVRRVTGASPARVEKVAETAASVASRSR